MSRTAIPARALRRASAAVPLAAAAVLLAAVPAFAHVEAEAEGAQALAENVKISFSAESESDSAGITELRVVLPQGIAPADVKLAEGPKGWELTANPDGYTVKGPAVPVREDAKYAITVRKLPDAKELAFKTIQTYSDKRVDRWIELGAGSQAPAPVLKLKPAAPGATPVTSSSPAATPSTAAPSTPAPQASASTAATAEKEKDDDSGLSAGAWVGVVAGAVALAAAAVYVVRRRSAQH